MEYNSTDLFIAPNKNIKPDIWKSFVSEFPLCSNVFNLPQNLEDRYKFMSALMIANIFDTLMSSQQLKKLDNIYESLEKILNDKDQPSLIQQYIVNLMKPLKTMISNLQPFDFNKIDCKQQHEQNINIVQEYLQNNRKYIYSYLDNQQGINTLFQLSRGIALSLYLQPDYGVITQVEKSIKQFNKQEIINRLCSDDLEINQQNYFILEDYEVIAISHLLNIPIYLFFNYFEQQSNYLTKRIVNQQQNQKNVIAFFFDTQQNNFTVGILSSNQDILYIQNIINLQQKILPIDQPKQIVEYIQQIIESIINQATQDFYNLNKFWVVKILQIIQLGEAQTLITNKLTTKINEQFSRESLNLFQLLKIDPKMHEEFVLNSEMKLKQAEECIENIIISQITMIRDQITNIVNKNKNSLILSRPNQIPNQSQKQNTQNIAGKLIAKDLDDDLPESVYDRDFNIQTNVKQNKSISSKTSDKNKNQQSIIYLTKKFKPIRSEIIKQKVSTLQQQQQQQSQRSLENTIIEANLSFQNDYLISCQKNRSKLLKAQSEIYVQKCTGNETDNLGFEPKKQIRNQLNKQRNSQIMVKQPEIDNNLNQNYISESLNESNSVIFNSQDISCPICFTKINDPSLIRNLHDDHNVCNSCLEDWIKVKFNSGQWNFKYFKCPIQVQNGEIIKPCENIIDQLEIKSILTPEEFSKLAETAMKQGIITIICPYQSCQTSIKGMLPQDQNQLLCPQCSLKICWVCKNEDHGESKCPQRLDEIKVALQDERVSCCPGCLEIFMKNDGCEHVQCTNCLIEFCFSCSAHRPPILAHGAHFHRVGCQYRCPWWRDQSKTIENLDEEYLPNECEYCKRNQKACSRPSSLANFKSFAHLNF